jgi:hypothetical protein
MMGTFEQIATQMVVLPTGVLVVAVLLLLVLGFGLVFAGIRTAVQWRRLKKRYGTTEAIPPPPHREDRAA